MSEGRIPNPVSNDCHGPIVLVTGRLAETAVRRIAAELATKRGMELQVAVLPISVAALMHVRWIARKLELERLPSRVVLPGWCQGDLELLESQFGVRFERGPKDVHELPDYFGHRLRPPDLLDYDIEILAEINHAPRLDDADVVRMAEHFRAEGADVIDLGCVPSETWKRAGEVTALLRREGFRVSIDSFDRREVEDAVAAGAELVLSCNGSNCEWASRLGVEVVAIPDHPRDLSTLENTIERLDAAGARYRIDPVLEPLLLGFSASLARFVEARRRWPGIDMLMGVGNLTELTEVDSAGINVLLAGSCQELRVGSVLTTQVINWARSSVRELDLARRMLHEGQLRGTPPKHVDARLVLLRDPKVLEMTDAELDALAEQITDPNYRVFVQGGQIHLLNRDGHWQGADPFALIRQAMGAGRPLDPSHAFYLGYEMAKAVTALTLGKRYVQDEALSWGFLTVPESSTSQHVTRFIARQDAKWTSLEGSGD